MNATVQKFRDTHWESSLDLKWASVAFVCTLWVLLRTLIPRELLPNILQTATLGRIGHALVYAVITAFLLFALKGQSVRCFPLTVFLGIAAISAVDEVTQICVGYSADLGDFAADLVGVAMVHIILFLRQLHGQSGSGTADLREGDRSTPPPDRYDPPERLSRSPEVF